MVPAITHVDYSARVQTIDEQRHPRFSQDPEAFYEKTGSPVLINTSFNVRGEPIVCTPEDAYKCFMGTNMDVLVLERLRAAQERAARRQGRSTARPTSRSSHWTRRMSKMIEIDF